MAGSIFRRKMRSLRIGKMRESKREKENWVSFSLLPGALEIVQTYRRKYGQIQKIPGAREMMRI